MKLFRLLVVALVLMAGCVHTGRVAFGQAVGLEMGVPQFFDANGNPLNGGKLYSYSAASSSQLFLYTNKELTIPYADPLVLNSAGRPAGPVYMQNYPYKLELYTSAGALVWTADYQYPSSVFAGGWYNTSGVFLRPANVLSDVLVGASSAADCCTSSGRLEVVGTEFRVLSDATANSNFLAVRATGGAITFEGRLNGTASYIPMHWRGVGACSSPCMILDASTGTDKLTLGTVATPGVLTVVALGSSSTYDAQGVTSNTVVTTGLTATNAYFGTATSADTLLGSAVPLYVKRASGTFAVFNDTAGSTGSLVLVTSSTSSTVTGGTTGASMTLNSNATGNSPVMTMGVYTAATMGTGFAGFAVTDATNGFIFQVDATSNAATTGMLIWHNGALQRVGLGAADSCAAGFRCLRVLN